MKLTTISTFFVLGRALGFERRVRAAPVNCTGEFTPVTAADAFAALSPGWNLGNSLDAIPNEDSWNNAPVQEETFDDILDAGYKSVRVPVTWADHMQAESPWEVDAEWMDRVEEIVDQVLERGFYAILNVHHDSWEWADLSLADANYTFIEGKFGALWTQIGERFACKSSALIFEPINEPVGDTQEHATELNKLNDIFLERINDAGGFNPQRVVVLTGLGHDSVKTSQWFERGDSYPEQPWGIQFHYYSPYDFIFGAWGKTIWGSDEDKSLLDTDFSLFRNNFTDIPTVIGEWQASPGHTESAARWKYYDFFIRSCTEYNFAQTIWDNGLDFFDREARTFYDPTGKEIISQATEGAINSLADSTTDIAADGQFSSAYLFHLVGTEVTDQSVSYLLNDNTLTDIADSAGTSLTTSQYSMSSAGNLTLTADYLSTLYAADGPAGVKETLTLTFSAGSYLTLQIVQYDTPTVEATSYPVQDTELSIPVTYAGLAEVATVKAVLLDGTYLADDWTQYLGPLQQARWTYSNYEWDDANLILTVQGLTTISEAGQDVILTWEFFPRSVGENAVNVTIARA